MRPRFAAFALLFLAGCASPPAMPPLPERVRALLPADVLLLGEQHDAEAHQRIGRETVEWLAAEGRLAALALEMAEQGRSTRGLASSADEAAVQAAAAEPSAKAKPKLEAAAEAVVVAEVAEAVAEEAVAEAVAAEVVAEAAAEAAQEAAEAAVEAVELAEVADAVAEEAVADAADEA